MDAEHRARLEERLALIDGLLRALDRWNEVAPTIWMANDRSAARDWLMGPPLELSRDVASYVLDLPAGRTTQLGRRELREELTHIRGELSEAES